MIRRIVAAGYPPVEGAGVLAKRRLTRENLDHPRRLLMREPRGHADMHGAVPAAPDDMPAGGFCSGEGRFASRVQAALNRRTRDFTRGQVSRFAIFRSWRD